MWCGDTVVSGSDKPNKELSLSHDRNIDMKSLMTSNGGWLKITQTNDGGQALDITSQHFFPFFSCTQNIWAKVSRVFTIKQG